MPSPLEDAPSPADSESPSHGNGGAAPVPRDHGSRCVLGGALSTGNLAHGQWDNRDVEDMELCEGEEPEGTAIIGEWPKQGFVWSTSFVNMHTFQAYNTFQKKL